MASSFMLHKCLLSLHHCHAPAGHVFPLPGCPPGWPLRFPTACFANLSVRRQCHDVVATYLPQYLHYKKAKSPTIQTDRRTKRIRSSPFDVSFLPLAAVLRFISTTQARRTHRHFWLALWYSTRLVWASLLDRGSVHN